MQPADGSVTSQVLEIRDNDGSMPSGSTSASEGPTSESSHETARKGLVWSKLSLEDQTAILGELVSICQQAVYRYSKERDLFALTRIDTKAYIFGQPGVNGAQSIRGITPTTFSLMHWLNKLCQISRGLFLSDNAPGLSSFISEVLAQAKELSQAVESGNQLDQSQVLKCVECAQIICTRFSGWTFNRQVRVIQDAIERGEVESLECIRRDGGAESQKRRRLSSE
jgi:hypothetical protein